MVEKRGRRGREGEGVGEATWGCCGDDGWVCRRRRVGMVVRLRGLCFSLILAPIKNTSLEFKSKWCD
ncbi:hypothetical protein PRUPE_7G068500 [Prunus persica]|uniref:Uncharacterized protein n=1 Tax=Prunus persica TaxID=3760 RepID=A0A251NAX8_PRUPE|nr:hypothetical protein PRUPE_7G068500 [Prunus persica]